MLKEVGSYFRQTYNRTVDFLNTPIEKRHLRYCRDAALVALLAANGWMLYRLNTTFSSIRSDLQEMNQQIAVITENTRDITETMAEVKITLEEILMGVKEIGSDLREFNERAEEYDRLMNPN